MEEAQFINEGEAVVTSTRVVLAGKTFATRNIGSVSQHKAVPSKFWPGVLIAVGLLCILGGGVPVGIVLIVVGAGLIWLRRPTYELRLIAGGGEVLALSSSDGAFVQRVHDAIVSAIAVR